MVPAVLVADGAALGAVLWAALAARQACWAPQGQPEVLYGEQAKGK